MNRTIFLNLPFVETGKPATAFASIPRRTDHATTHVLICLIDAILASGDPARAMLESFPAKRLAELSEK